MNRTQARPYTAFDVVARRQGWSEAVQLDVLRDFIAERKLDRELYEFARNVARSEPREG